MPSSTRSHHQAAQHDPQERAHAQPPTIQRGTSQASSKRELWPDLVAGLKATLEPEVVRLAAMEPEIELSLWRNFAHLATTPSPDAVGA